MAMYRVVVGCQKDFYGCSTGVEIAKYFSNEAEAKKLYAEGERFTEVTEITRVYEDGYKSKGETGVAFFEREKELAKETMKKRPDVKITVKKKRKPYNIYRLEVIG